MSEAFRKVRDLYYRGGERYGRRDCTVLVEDGGTFVLVARDEDKLARRMDDGSHISAASMPSFAASTTGRHPTHVNVKGCSSTWQACLDPRWVGGISENKRDDRLGRHFAGTQGVLARPQSVKIEADDVTRRRSREQVGSPSVARLPHYRSSRTHLRHGRSVSRRAPNRTPVPAMSSRPFWQVNQSPVDGITSGVRSAWHRFDNRR